LKNPYNKLIEKSIQKWLSKNHRGKKQPSTFTQKKNKHKFLHAETNSHKITKKINKKNTENFLHKTDFQKLPCGILLDQTMDQ
jgi:hypothetical protein